MLNKIILALINSNKYLQPSAMSSDSLEQPKTYKGWIFPLRYLLALRYLKVKRKVLEDFRQQKIYPVKVSEFKPALIKALTGRSKKATANTQKAPLYATGFKAMLVYPVLVIILGVAASNIYNWYELRKIENVLANYLPYYSDLLHRRLILKQNTESSVEDKLTAEIDKQQKKILENLPEKNGIRASLARELDQLKDSAVDSEAIMLGFKKVNTVFDQHGLPFYLSPKSFTMPCSSLIDAPVEQMLMLKKLEQLMSNNNPELCRTTMMTTYKVHERNQLFYSEGNGANAFNDAEETEFPLFRVKRIDKVPAVDSALGLTFKERGIGSIILLERIKRFATESILPALTFQGRNYVIPYWMQGYYEIEEAVTEGYKKDLNQIYADAAERRKVKVEIKKLIRNKFRMSNSKMEQTLQRTNNNDDKNIFGNGFDAISVLLGKSNEKGQNKQKPLQPEKVDFRSFRQLDKVLLPSIEFHEAYHQIDKKNWQQPGWVADVFKDKLSENSVDHTMEELGAYLSQLATTDEGLNIWLSKLLIFSLNPMTKGQAEYYASGLILNTMESLSNSESVEPSYIATVDEKTEIYKNLIRKDPAEIRYLAKKAYEILFERVVPVLH